MLKLTAKQHILYESKLYAPGDVLPSNNSDMVEAWISAETAVWIDDEKQVNKSAKASPRTAEPGLPGAAVASDSEDGENLVGKVPKTSARKKK